jgi:hypothetical protein
VVKAFDSNLLSDIKSIRGQEFESLGRRHRFCLMCAVWTNVLCFGREGGLKMDTVRRQSRGAQELLFW